MPDILSLFDFNLLYKEFPFNKKKFKKYEKTFFVFQNAGFFLEEKIEKRYNIAKIFLKNEIPAKKQFYIFIHLLELFIFNQPYIDLEAKYKL